MSARDAVIKNWYKVQDQSQSGEKRNSVAGDPAKPPPDTHTLFYTDSSSNSSTVYVHCTVTK